MQVTDVRNHSIIIHVGIIIVWVNQLADPKNFLGPVKGLLAVRLVIALRVVWALHRIVAVQHREKCLAAEPAHAQVHDPVGVLEVLVLSRVVLGPGQQLFLDLRQVVVGIQALSHKEYDGAPNQTQDQFLISVHHILGTDAHCLHSVIDVLPHQGHVLHHLDLHQRLAFFGLGKLTLDKRTQLGTSQNLIKIPEHNTIFEILNDILDLKPPGPDALVDVLGKQILVPRHILLIIRLELLSPGNWPVGRLGMAAVLRHRSSRSSRRAGTCK
mmetsp:Transcript_40094/g.87527  ORF Transcript_40094/g.87527 Transcript_40094/m.87527 type:complete len:270 (-) Transcript_40094:21-830(-)